MAPTEKQRERLKRIADETLKAIADGVYTLDDNTYDLAHSLSNSKLGTRYYSPDSMLSNWSTMEATSSSAYVTEISILEISTLAGSRMLSKQAIGTIGVLNFASAKKPGGGFLTGAQAQEESIARSSTLYPTLMTTVGQNFYTLHKRDSKGGYYTHAMIYSPGVIAFRDDDGNWKEPLTVDVLTSAAVNAGIARKSFFGQVAGKNVEGQIERVMRERMARILFLFEQQGVPNLVLGSFGTGVFQNNVGTVARIWAELLVAPNARFKRSFRRVLFAILGRQTVDDFIASFDFVAAAAGVSYNKPADRASSSRA
jgi:uncharacterized protein (TIGR02452 family)